MLQRLIEFACCPADHGVLSIGSAALVDRLNLLIEQRGLRELSGTLLTEPHEALLVRADQSRAYPVRGGIPVLLIPSAILLDDDDRAVL